MTKINHMRKFTLFAVVLTALMGLYACQQEAKPESANPAKDQPIDDHGDEEGEKPKMTVTVTTENVDDITLYEAKCHGNYAIENAPEEPLKIVTCAYVSSKNNKVDAIIAEGNYWWADETEEVSGNIDALAEELSANTEYYYVMAIIINDDAVYTGTVKKFTTKNFGDYAEPVDLGLSVKWCNINIGQTTPKELYSLFFAWGDVELKEYWGEKYYRFYDEQGNTTAYRGEDYPTDPLKLRYIDDTAYQLLGHDWRMPTNHEFEELIKGCSWVYENTYWKVTSKNGNGNSIYLLGEGYIDTDGTEFWGNHMTSYWGSEYPDYEPTIANSLFLDNTRGIRMIDNTADRACGFYVRAVYRGE